MKKIIYIMLCLLVPINFTGCELLENDNKEEVQQIQAEEPLRPHFEAIAACDINSGSLVYFPVATVGSIGTKEKNNNDYNIIFIWDNVEGIEYGYYVSILNFKEPCSDRNNTEIVRASKIKIERATITNTLYNNYPLIIADREHIEVIQ